MPSSHASPVPVNKRLSYAIVLATACMAGSQAFA